MHINNEMSGILKHYTEGFVVKEKNLFQYDPDPIAAGAK